MSKSKLIQIICTLCFCSFSHLSLAQSVEVKASVDKNPIMVDESFILSVIANGELNSNAFDSSFLMKDFVVGRTSVSSQTKVINFNTTKSTTWSTVLIPRKQGNFTIPSFDLQGNKTEPLDITVIPVSTSSNTEGRDLYITTEVDLEQAYLQQQINYKVKLHVGTNLQRGSLSTPTLENADIRQIGKDKEYNEIIDNRRYRIIERSFAIVPQQSGSFTINGPLFEGEIADNTQQSFGFFNRSKIINRVGPDQVITVKPIPSGYNEHWLPSEFVQINDEWQIGSNGLVTGEPVTRTVTLTAVGVVEEQLPEISGSYPNSVKTYPDKAETATLEKDNTLIAQRKESIAIIPNEVGDLIIPEVKVPWFNTVTGKTEFATLPAKTLHVKQSTIKPSSNLDPIPTAEDLSEPNTNPTMNVSTIPPVIQTSYWQWVALAILTLWIATLFFWWRHVKSLSLKSEQPQSSIPRTTESEQVIWKNLEKSLDKNDAVSTQKYLAFWLGHVTKDKNAPISRSIVKLNDSELNKLVNELLASRYSEAQTSWSGKNLHNVLRQLRKTHKNSKQKSTDLAPLYPII